MRSNRPAHRAVAGRLFWLSATLGTAGMFAAAAAVAAAISSVRRVSFGAGYLKLAGLALSYPRPSGSEWLLVGLAAVGATTITVAARAACRQRSALRRLLLSLEIVGALDKHHGQGDCGIEARSILRRVSQTGGIHLTRRGRAAESP